MTTKINPEKLPQHLAIMIDGNRRWAKKRGLPPEAGHEAGIKMVVRIINHSFKRGIKVLTLYGFSTENWKRSEQEVNHLMKIFVDFSQKYAPLFYKKKIQFRHLGDLNRLPSNLQKSLLKAQRLTKKNDKMILNIALNYGGRDEIVRAIKKIIKDQVPAEKITEELVLNYLDTKGLPEVDFVIRTSGEMRLSNFLPLQSTYAELYFSKVLWPDFDEKQLDLALKEFQRRKRNFGR